MTGAHFMESVVHMELLRDPVKILWSSHIGHGTFAAIVVHQLFHALASLRGQRLPVVLLQRPRYLPKSGSQHFSRELRCPDRKGNRFLVYFFLHKTSFPSGFPLSGRPPYNLGEQKTSGQCGPRLTARHLCRTELSFPAPSGLFRPVPAWSAR